MSLYVAPGLRWTTPLGVAVYGSAHLPAYQKVNESQLAAGLVILVGAARSF